MKIAMLCPLSWSKSSRHYGPSENSVSLLAEQLLSMGIDVTLFAGGDSQTQGERAQSEDPPINPNPRECLHIAEVFGRAQEFDLIHNHLDFLPLSYSGFIHTPLLTTLYGLPLPSVLPVYKKYNKQSHYVAISEADKHPELDYIATIPDGIDAAQFSCQQMARQTLDVYRMILDGRENYRPWGHYQNLLERDDHKIKEIIVEPGGRLSLQKHRRRAEHWTVVSGEALVTVDDQQIRLLPGASVDIPRGAVHRVMNPGDTPLIFVEVQMGDYFGEDDIIRLEDDYGR